jgi:hypothetical protein
MLWEQFKNTASQILSDHFAPNLIEDNGDSLVFTDRRSLASFFVTEDAREIAIGRYEERNTIGMFFTSPSIELATIALTLLAREGLGKLVDMHYPTDELLGPVPGTDYSITRDRSRGFHLTHKTDSTLSADCDYFTYARAIALAASKRDA